MSITGPETQTHTPEQQAAEKTVLYINPNRLENGSPAEELDDAEVHTMVLGDLMNSLAELHNPNEYTPEQMQMDWWKEEVAAGEAAIKVEQWFLDDTGETPDPGDEAFFLGDEAINHTKQRFTDSLQKYMNSGLSGAEARKMVIDSHNTAMEQLGDNLKYLEVLDPAEVMVDVTQAAENRTLVYLYAIDGIHTRRGPNGMAQAGGYTTFGSGLDQNPNTFNNNNSKLLNDNLPEQPSSEFVQFMPSTAANLPPTVRNPKSGEEEAAVVVRYRFKYTKDDEQLASVRGGFKLPPYHEPTHRGQNLVEVATVLPQSIADKLRAVLAKNPEAIRVLVDDLVQTEGGLTQSDWMEPKRAGYDTIKQRPPYEGLPADWQIQIVDTKA